MENLLSCGHKKARDWDQCGLRWIDVGSSLMTGEQLSHLGDVYLKKSGIVAGGVNAD
ncbi:hypothetical protein [Noviherbaspirillum sp.]|jgi:hypothetical protein|uniref:hypothetical protein n=1 Tax=Noviherbaspirillum sp. TaxID=1926288 RepID=UPI002FE409DD